LAQFAVDLRVHDGWGVDSAWTIQAFSQILSRTQRKPRTVVHDHGAHFRGQFERQLRVLEIDEDVPRSLRRSPQSTIGRSMFNCG